MSNNVIHLFTMGTACWDDVAADDGIAEHFNRKTGILDGKGYIVEGSEYEQGGGSAINTWHVAKAFTRAIGYDAMVYVCSAFGNDANNPRKKRLMNELGVEGFGDPGIMDIYFGQPHTIQKNRITINRHNGHAGRYAQRHRKQALPISPTIRTEITDKVLQSDVLMLHSHYHELALHAAKEAKENTGALVLLDWSEDAPLMSTNIGEVIRYADWTWAPDDALLPGMKAKNPDELFKRLIEEYGCQNVAVSGNSDPVRYYSEGREGFIEVREVDCKDNLGAGDAKGAGVAVGGACRLSFVEALKIGTELGTFSVQEYGRKWVDRLAQEVLTNTVYRPLLRSGFQQTSAPALAS